MSSSLGIQPDVSSILDNLTRASMIIFKKNTFYLISDHKFIFEIVKNFILSCWKRYPFAVKKCANNRAHIPIVRNDKENDQLTAKIRKLQKLLDWNYFWTGIERFDQCNAFFETETGYKTTYFKEVAQPYLLPVGVF